MGTKYIIVTGGVISGLGKGIAVASIGHLLSSNLKVIPMKLDGYLNVDPGTMNPLEHGEVFVLDDGGEVDMDFGHYERFLNVVCKSKWNLTMGKIFNYVREKERRGDYLGKTVQYIPHVTNAIKEKITEVAKEERADIMLVEIGGTIGDLENELYVEAVRELKKDVGTDNILYVHLTYVPLPSTVKEQKSKPTQQSVNLLRQKGIQPDIIIGRCKELLTDKIKKRISTFCDVEQEAVITGLDVDNIYKIPLVYYEEGILGIINKKLNLNIKPNLEVWKDFLNKDHLKEVKIAMCGKYTNLEDSYASVIEALNQSGANLKTNISIKWIETTDIEEDVITVEEALKDVQGVIVPGGFGERGAEGKIKVINYARENNIPFLGLCYGMQLAVIEYARNVCNLKNANSSEINPDAEFKVVDLLPDQIKIHAKGATMRLGGQDIEIKPNTKASKLFGNSTRLRFRHRYEINPEYLDLLESKGMLFSGKQPNGKIMQICELPNHPFFMATQAHPELTSRLEAPNRLFYDFLQNAIQEKVKPLNEV